VRKIRSRRVNKKPGTILGNCKPLAVCLCLWLAPGAAHAGIARDVAHDVVSFLGFHAEKPRDVSRPASPLTERALQAPTPVVAAPEIARVAPPPPSTETPLHRLFCVEYARARSGLAILGDARTWWKKAKNLYARASTPVENAVMVFSGSKRLKRGHVAVVTDIVGPRRIIVDQANWQNHGEIDHATPVLDVSEDNDWSKVRVWNIHAGQFGTHVYAISGFIMKELVRQASND
jgi:hypothetical protein